MNRSRRFAVLAAVASLATIGALALLPFGREKSASTSAAATEYEPPPAGMVLVPAGEFIMGSIDASAEPDERPARKVSLPAFYIDRFEVTNRRYREFKKDHLFPPGEEDLPVTFVLKREAEAFCQCAGRRLPSNAEWEKAARGTDGRVYPWGNEFLPDRANVNKRLIHGATNGAVCHSPLEPSRGKEPGGRHPLGASPYGCEDMAGNVWEWVSDDWVDAHLWGSLETPTRRGILRGGASSYSARQARTSYQGFEALDATCHDVGFRCALDARPKRKMNP